MSNKAKKGIFFWELFLVIRCIYRCQKWIPDKILHRNSNLIFFSTFIFSSKNIILKMKKYFFRKFQKSFSKKYFSFRKFYKGKIFFPKGFLKIFGENIFQFSKWKILSKKNELTKKSNYHFDVEFCQESIFGIHKCNGSLKIALRRNIVFSEKNVLFSC